MSQELAVEQEIIKRREGFGPEVLQLDIMEARQLFEFIRISIAWSEYGNRESFLQQPFDEI